MGFLRIIFSSATLDNGIYTESYKLNTRTEKSTFPRENPFLRCTPSTPEGIQPATSSPEYAKWRLTCQGSNSLLPSPKHFSLNSTVQFFSFFFFLLLCLFSIIITRIIIPQGHHLPKTHLYKFKRL